MLCQTLTILTIVQHNLNFNILSFLCKRCHIIDLLNFADNGKFLDNRFRYRIIVKIENCKISEYGKHMESTFLLDNLFWNSPGACQINDV